ncbi:hypothetical protein F5887DRAFT_873488 [Amanita rubescens]|nr:hypothetical protein F5887DRAFT_873488 [Amanita rubescens]
MVSADNLNRDVLELIFTQLNANDLCSATLVSRSFFTAATPRLYRTLFFRREQALKFLVRTSPFATILAHPSHSVHVHAIVDIRSIPASNRMPHPEFTRQIAEAIKLCKNLRSFTCTVTSFRFLHYLENESELSELRIAAQLSNEHFQATRLAKFSAIQSLSLLQGSWNVMNVLPRWSRSVRQTLTSLVLYMCDTLNDTVLESVLVNLPQLVILHIVRCDKVNSISILRFSKHTPLLRSLAMTLIQGPRSGVLRPTILTHLRELTLDLLGIEGSTAASSMSYIRRWLPPLSSLHLRSAATIPDTFFLGLLEDHAPTLVDLSFHCPLDVISTITICLSRSNLEELAIPFPIQNFVRSPLWYAN